MTPLVDFYLYIIVYRARAKIRSMQKSANSRKITRKNAKLLPHTRQNYLLFVFVAVCGKDYRFYTSYAA